MARVFSFVLLVSAFTLATLASAASAGQVHPTERDEILEMINALGSSSEDRVEAAREALLAKGGTAAPFLLDALKLSRSEAIRMEAATLLGEARDDAALSPLFVAAQIDTSPRVRMAAQLGLERLVADLNERRIADTHRRDYEKVTRDVITEFKKRLKTDPDKRVRIQAARSLGTYGAETDLDTLYDRAKRDKAPQVRVACYEAIRRLTYPIVLARDFQALSRDPVRRPRNPIAVQTTKKMTRRLFDEKDPDVRMAIVENLTGCVYPIFLLGERRLGRGGPLLDDHSWMIEEVTDKFSRDLEDGSDSDVKRAEIAALIRLLSAYYRVGDVDLQDEIRRRITSEFRRSYFVNTSDYRGILIRVRFDRHYRTSPPNNDKIAERVSKVMKDLFLEEEDWRVRQLAVEALGLFGDKSDSITIVKGLRSERNNDVWETAIHALGLLDKNSSATYLLELYSNPKAPARLRAAAALSIGLIHYPRETRQLAARLKQEPSLEVGLAVIEALSYRRDATTARVLFDQLRHSKAEVRTAALVSLRYNPHKGSAGTIQSLLLADPDPAVRAAAAATLATVAKAQAVPTLARAVADESPEVRRAVVVELGLLKAVSAVDALIAAATGDPDPEVRIEAAVSLGQIRDQKAIEPLVRRVPAEQRADNRRAIYEALLAIREPNTVIVSIWGKLPQLRKDNPVVYDELQTLLVYLRAQNKGRSVKLPG